MSEIFSGRIVRSIQGKKKNQEKQYLKRSEKSQELPNTYRIYIEYI